MEARLERLEAIVEKIGEAVLATTETIDRLADRVDHLVIQVHEQSLQVQQQGYQLFALSEAVQTLVEMQSHSLDRMTQLTDVLQNLVTSIEETDGSES